MLKLIKNIVEVQLIDLLIIILGYFIGSLTWGIIITKYIKKKDVREFDYPGGAGVSRQFGLPLGILVGVLDGLKALLVMYLAKRFGTYNLTIILSYVTLMLGNNFPIYFGFKGGQGAALTIGASLFIFPIETIIAVIVGIIFIFLFNFLKLNRYIKFMGPVPFGIIFGLLTLFLIVILKGYPLYPYILLIIIAAVLLFSRGIMMIGYHKNRKGE